jgi:metal-sulfur cluster biosynthetic enzyme
MHIPTVEEAYVEVVFDPPWNASMMSDSARLATKKALPKGLRPACEPLESAPRLEGQAGWKLLKHKGPPSGAFCLNRGAFWALFCLSGQGFSVGRYGKSCCVSA